VNVEFLLVDDRESLSAKRKFGSLVADVIDSAAPKESPLTDLRHVDMTARGIRSHRCSCAHVDYMLTLVVHEVRSERNGQVHTGACVRRPPVQNHTPARMTWF
jgi:hypothetical protein